MSWPWRPNTWEKGLRLQVSISSMAGLLRWSGEVLRLKKRKVEWESASECGRLAITLDQSSPLQSLNWLLICLWRHFTTSPTPFPGMSFAFYSCLPADCRSVPRLVASDAVRVAAALQLMGDLRWVALSLLIRALVWRCFRQRALQTQDEQSKRERERVRESNEKENPAAERRQTLSPDESKNRDDCVCMRVHVCVTGFYIIL